MLSTHKARGRAHWQPPTTVLKSVSANWPRNAKRKTSSRPRPSASLNLAKVAMSWRKTIQTLPRPMPKVETPKAGMAIKAFPVH